ncbi:hypothetical protein Pse7367_3836 (plasmid) [Thalassoporum mexicanum PCC 7367]|uniref:hypothetical protein n=1 Tax=Thalassoporum mexicanum TaxID=3457544 RepID=UPI00029F8CE7|nr:hypothetical protein [Pseudanabaena sp. PCC 7367]AFY72059.1 hypothetical protein Pse7367_3836 [Pseudanabaena sp. PCC 7367]
MPDYQESGLNISLPNNQCFRFCDLNTYKGLKGKQLKEVDFCWWDSSRNTFWLLEVKDYSHLTSIEKLPDHLLENLTNKITDSLLILGAAWSGTNKGQNILHELPSTFRIFPMTPHKMKIVCILKLTEHHKKVYLKPLKDNLNNRLAGRVALFDLQRVTLIDHGTASTMGLPITSM